MDSTAISQHHAQQLLTFRCLHHYRRIPYRASRSPESRDFRHLASYDFGRARKPAKPSAPKPSANIPHVDGSGTPEGGAADDA